MNDEQFIQRDRMRFTKNTQSSSLALLAIVFNVVYFVSLYQSNVGSYYYNWLMGVSIVYNLVFMLAAFLSSEGVKSYKLEYSVVLLILAVIQVLRIFLIPTRAHGAVVSIGGVDTAVMGNGQFMLLVICLGVSAACLAASGVINYSKCKALEAHMKTLAEKTA